MVDERCYGQLTYWGKIGKGQSRIIIDEIVSLPEGREYSILHIGSGASNPFLRDGLTSWLQCVYYTQFSGMRLERINPFNRKICDYPTMVRKVNYILSDIQPITGLDLIRYNSESIVPDLKSEDWIKTGLQEFRAVDAKNTQFQHCEIDIVIALGFFSNKVLNDTDACIILLEIYRVLKPTGKLLTSVHEHYVRKLTKMCEEAGLEVQVLDISSDSGPDDLKSIGVRHLMSIHKK
jgi:hypothetical protein